MSAVIETFLLCDTPQCDNSFGVDTRNQSVREQRRDAKLNGWKFVKGKDYCPECIRKQKELSNTAVK